MQLSAEKYIFQQIRNRHVLIYHHIIIVGLFNYGRYDNDFEYVIFKLIIHNSTLGTQNCSEVNATEPR